MKDQELFTEISKSDLKSFDFITEISGFEKSGILLSPESLLILNKQDGKRVLNLVDEKKKAFILINCSFFTFLLQNLPKIFLFYSRIKHREIKLYIKTLPETETKDWQGIKEFLLKYLNDLGVDFEFINDDLYDATIINNFCVLTNDFSPLGIMLLNSKTKKYIDSVKTEPFRKVFVARDKSLPQRVDSDKEMQDFFINQGFEIIYPENFNSFIDQINYFNECRVIAGISGSALSNCVFMKPGGTVIELLSIFRPNGDNYPIETHHYYRIMANAMRHLYFSISNLTGKSNDFFSNKKALNIIQML
jgi:capsular polysaccharide biosynthesis protein